jgi:tetratricopeptide (TPR) repeat protein
MNCLILFLAAATASDDTAMVLNTKAQKLLQKGRLPEAARTFAQAAGLASNDLAAAMILRNEALTVLRMDDPAAARQLAEQALALVERAAGPRDRHLTPILNALAEVAVAERRYADAETLLRRAIAIGESAGPHFAKAVHNREVVARLRNRGVAARSAGGF